MSLLSESSTEAKVGSGGRPSPSGDEMKLVFVHKKDPRLSLKYFAFPTFFQPLFIFQGGDGSSSARISSRRTGEEPHIGKYRLLKTIGKGNFAKVKLAKHIPTGKEVSLFIIHRVFRLSVRARPSRVLLLPSLCCINLLKIVVSCTRSLFPLLL